MRVTAIGVDPLRGLPLVTLSDEAGGVTIEIEVGLPDAQAIASELRGVVMERPATHDLLKAIVEACGGRVVAVELREVRAGDPVVFRPAFVALEIARQNADSRYARDLAEP